MQESDNKKQLWVTLAVLLVVVIVVVGAVALTRPKNTKSISSSSTDKTATTTSTASTADTGATDSTATYKDGTYGADGTYNSPAGEAKINVSVTLKDGIVTDSTVTGHASDREAKEYQEDFIDGYKKLVTGKKIDTISLSRVSGSSLTSEGFNAALKQIEADAKA